MAIAKAPQYSAYNRKRLQKKPSVTMGPKKQSKPAKLSSFAVPSLPKKAPYPIKKVAPIAKAPAPKSVVPPPPALQTAAPIAIPLGPPPQSLTSASDRVSAREGYNLGLSGVNRALMAAALRYGGAPTVQQFGYDPTGKDTSSLLGVTTNPEDNSALSVIRRNAELSSKNIDEATGAENTFFSSKRLGDLGDVNNDADRQRIEAKAEYDAAIADYLSQLTGMRGTRDEAFRNADIADILAAQEAEARNQLATPAPEPAAAKPKATPKKAAPKPKAKAKGPQWKTGKPKAQSSKLKAKLKKKP